MEKQELDFEGDLKIDTDALDVEWAFQAQTFMRYAEKATQARSETDKKKEALEVVKATLDKEIRSNPEANGITKVTEGAISSAILLNPAYQKASEELIEAKHTADLLMNAVRAFDQRKDALENLVRLQGQQYFAGPTEPRDIDVECLKRSKQVAADSNRKAAFDRMKNHEGRRTESEDSGRRTK